MSDKKDTIDLRPAASSIAIYQNMAYTHWAALGEFVDNSVSSYEINRSQIKKKQGRDKLHIEITTTERDGGKIIIKDNAAGIDDETMQKAFAIGTPPKDNSGGNEFGMGMKVAACWYSKYWTVETKSSNEKYLKIISVDVKKIMKTNSAEMDIVKHKKDNDSSYTKITLENLNKIPTPGQTTDKIRRYLSSMYRLHLRKGEVEISYNGKKLYFEEVACLNDPKEEDKDTTNPKSHKWKKNVEFYFRKYKFYGFAGVREKGSTSEAGFHLFRRGRMIETTINTWRPEEIFLKSNSFRYQRIYGEIHVDDNIPVDITKTKLLWDDATESSFNTNLLDQIEKSPLDLVFKSENHRSVKTRQRNFVSNNRNGLRNASDRLQPNTKSIEKILSQDKQIPKLLKINKKMDDVTLNKIEIVGEEWEIETISSKDVTLNEWLTVKQDVKKKKVQIIISVDHPFSAKYFPDDTKELEGIYLIAQYIAIAEITSRKIGNTAHDYIRRSLNKQLLNISKIN